LQPEAVSGYLLFRRRSPFYSTGQYFVNGGTTNQDAGGNGMLQKVNQAGSFTLPGTSVSVNRVGYGAMQLAGKDGNKLVWGPPRDVEEAIRVLREAVAGGVNHIDTADFYGPHVTNQIIHKALFPYPGDLVIVTKIGVRRGEDASWIPAFSRQELTAAVHDNLRNLGLDVLDVVNLRVTFNVHQPSDGSIEAPVTALAEFQQKGLVRHIGLSNVTPAQVAEANRIVPIVCVQNHYNMAHRADDELIAELARDGVAYVPYFPLGGFTPLQSDALSALAMRLGATPMQLALAWLLQRSPNILVIPGTSSLKHLRENLSVATLQIPADVLAHLHAISSQDFEHPAAQQQR
jgi:pyridoxine 4-dehydrogenase